MKKEVFILNENRHLCLFSTDYNINELVFMDEVQVVWHDNNKEILIGMSFASDFGESLESGLTSTIGGNLLFDDSLCISPGVMLNKHFVLDELRPCITVMKNNGIEYNLFSAYEDDYGVDAYLYSDKHKNIIFEVAEKFCWLDKDELSEEELAQEEQRFLRFIDDYKPIIREIIPRGVAKKWLAQVKKLNKIILYNETKDCECGEKSFKIGKT